MDVVILHIYIYIHTYIYVYIHTHIYMYVFLKKINEKIQKTYSLLKQKVCSLRAEYTYNLGKKNFLSF